MRQIAYQIPKEADGLEIKAFLKKKGISARVLTKLKQTPDGICLNGVHATVRKRLAAGDVLTLRLEPDAEPAEPAPHLKADVLYEDADLLVLNKPPFMPVHPTRNHQGDTLANAVAAYLLNTRGEAFAFRPINRLDRDTSGIVVAALHTLAAAKLAKSLEKEYTAVIHGQADASGTIDLPIRRIDPMRIRREVHEEGARAVTHYRTILSDETMSYLSCRLETGRTHQIRVHFSHLGHALIGDTLYGAADERIGRQALHCASVSFVHPVTEEPMQLHAPLPDDLQALIDTIKKEASR